MMDDAHRPSIEEMERELAELRQFRQTTYWFLILLCKYTILQSLSPILSYSEFLQDPELDPDFLLRISKLFTLKSEEIRGVIADVVDAASPELTDEPPLGDIVNLYKSEKTDLHLVLQKALFPSKSEGYGRSKVLLDESKLQIKLPDGLPPIRSNPYMLEFILNGVSRYMVSRIVKDDMAFNASFDEKSVTLIISCAVLDDVPADILDQFASTSTFLALEPTTLSLYNSWQLLKLYGAEIKITPQSYSADRQSSGVSISIIFPRYFEDNSLPSNQHLDNT
jgi:hypothetical protein